MAFLLKTAASTVGKPVFNEIKAELTKNIGRKSRYLSTSHAKHAQDTEMSKPVQTMQEVKDKLAKLMGVESGGYKPIRESREYLLEYLPKTQEELEPRSMQDSFSSALIPLSTDGELQDRYITFLESVRLGRLLEDMDIFAVYIVHKHIKNPKENPDLPSPHNLVTVLVDKIDFTNFKPTPFDDIRLSGHVSWVGKSSVEVVVWLEQMRHNQWFKLTRALFLMAARNATHTKSAIVNAIKPANDEEKKILSGGVDRLKKRQEIQKQSLLKVIPTDEEQKIIHDLFIRTIGSDEIYLQKRVLPPGAFWMENCTLSNIIFSHPEHRNLHNKVFGGFIMRQAVELCWASAYLFSKYRPVLKHISDINFHKPIEVNSLIRMHSHIVFTTMQYVQVTAYAQSFEARSGVHNTTNVFHFTFELPELAPEVFPQTYQDAIMYLDGRRHFSNALNQKIKDSGLSSKL